MLITTESQIRNFVDNQGIPIAPIRWMAFVACVIRRVTEDGYSLLEAVEKCGDHYKE